MCADDTQVHQTRMASFRNVMCTLVRLVFFRELSDMLCARGASSQKHSKHRRGTGAFHSPCASGPCRRAEPSRSSKHELLQYVCTSAQVQFHKEVRLFPA